MGPRLRVEVTTELINWVFSTSSALLNIESLILTYLKEIISPLWQWLSAMNTTLLPIVEICVSWYIVMSTLVLEGYDGDSTVDFIYTRRCMGVAATTTIFLPPRRDISNRKGLRLSLPSDMTFLPPLLIHLLSITLSSAHEHWRHDFQ